VAGDTGIEPMFAIELKRRIRDFESGSWREVEILTEYLLPKIIDKDFRKKVEAQLAHEVKPINQLAILASFQKFIHTGISKTINCPYDTSVEEIKDLIKRSADFRLKGFTIFREGCREDTVLVKAKPCSPPQSKTSQRDKSEELSPVRFALVYEVRGTVNAYITTTFDEEKKLREVFINVGKAGTTLNSMFQAVGRIISVGLRRHPDLAERFIQTLKGIESGEFYSCNDLHSKSLPDMIAKIMEDAINKVRGSAPTLEALTHGSQIGAKGGIAEKTEEVRIAGDLCPICGNLSLMREGNCMTCENCGYTTC
jgi:ribonucleoside-diphosphate reductase alpha chain